MTTPPIDLELKTVTTKVSVDAWERAQALKAKLGCRLSDVVSACLLFMPEDELEKILNNQSQIVNSLPKNVRGLLGNASKLSAEEKQMIVRILSKD